MILCTAGVFILSAFWNLLKALHPRFRRGRPFRFTTLGLAFLSSIAAAECFIVVKAIYLVPLYPLWFPGAAVLGLAFFFICARIDDSREQSAKGAEARQRRQWPPGEETVFRIAGWYACILVLSYATTLFSLYGQLFGPQWGEIFAILAFVFAMLVFLLSSHPLGLRFRLVCPHGLSGRFSGLSAWQAFIERTLKITGACIFLATTLMFAASFKAGGPADNLPAFAQRGHYIFSKHGKRTEVSATRFFTSAVSGLVAWHAGSLFASLLALHVLLYGELPASFKRSSEFHKP